VPAIQNNSAHWQSRLKLTLGSKGPWLVAGCFAFYSGQWQAVVGFLPSIYAQSGVDAGWIGAMSALVAAVNMVGNLLSGRLLQRGWQPVHLLRIGYLAMALGAFLCFAELGRVWQVPAALRYLAVLGFSAVGGLIPGTLFMLSVRLAPSDVTVSTTVGFMQQLSALGQFAGPPLVAWVAQAAGSWGWTWLVTGTCSVFGLALVQQVRLSLESKSTLFQTKHPSP
jgi:cyanate permease